MIKKIINKVKRLFVLCREQGVLSLWSYIKRRYIFKFSTFYHQKDSLACAEAGVSGVSVGQNMSDDFIRRITVLYNSSKGISADDSKNPQSGEMWNYIVEEHFSELHEAFVGMDEKAVRAILSEPDKSDIFYGFDIMTKCFTKSFDSEGKRKAHAVKCFDDLLRLAEFLGAVRLYNPGSVPFDLPQPEVTLEAIEKKIGVTLDFPNPYPRENGLVLPSGVMSYRVPQAIYQAWRIKQLTKGIKNPRVLEIGAGLGRTAYYARLFGIKDYTIVDIPSTLVSQAYYLGACLGEERVVLHGERTRKDGVKIMPPEAFFAGDQEYDLIVNCDSLTELNHEIAEDYWKKISSICPMFLSVNHEVNGFRILDFIEGSKVIKSADRYPYWMRHGYVEEFIQFKTS